MRPNLLTISICLLAIDPAASFAPRTSLPSRTCRLGTQAAESRSDQEPSTPCSTEFFVQVQFEDFSSTDTISVRQGESLLSALERAASSQGWSEVPSDCRRGNCLTCTAKHSDTSVKEHVEPLTEDGLSPSLSINGNDNSGDDSFFLTCRSTVTGPGVELSVGQNSAVWNHMYKTRFANDSTRQATDAALARVWRKAAESDPERWRQQTEAVWEQQQKGVEYDNHPDDE